MKLSLRLPRREVLLIAAAAAAAVIVTLAVLIGTSNARERRLTPQAGEEQGRKAAPAAPEALSLEDFLLPEPPRPASLPGYYPFRPRLRQWNRELVDRFWISPRQVAVEMMGAVNDRNMEDFFKDAK